MSRELDDDHVVAICRVLRDHQVAFVIVGGIAARLHATGYATVDLDICPSRDQANLQNLAKALRALGARHPLPHTRHSNAKIHQWPGICHALGRVARQVACQGCR